MSIYVQNEDRLAHDLSANGTSVLHANEFGHFPGYGLFTLLSKSVALTAAVLKQSLQADQLDRIGSLADHMRRDIGLVPTNAKVGGALYYDQGSHYL